MKIEKLIKRAQNYYLKALELLETRDFYDASEKAWLAVETLRKAFLVAMGVPYEKTRSINYSLPLFSRVMRALGYDEMLKNYEWFHHKLHAMGFYENITPMDEIVMIIKKDVSKWLEKMIEIIKSVRNIDITTALKEYEKAIKIKREIISKNVKLLKIYRNLDTLLSKIVTTKKQI
ncbi:MAG: PaREP1 family protein [Candidatus Njordarchaeales archaeon]